MQKDQGDETILYNKMTWFTERHENSNVWLGHLPATRNSG